MAAKKKVAVVETPDVDESAEQPSAESELVTEAPTVVECACPVRTEFCEAQLDPEQRRLLGVFAQSIGISQGQYIHAFSHGVSFAQHSSHAQQVPPPPVEE